MRNPDSQIVLELMVQLEEMGKDAQDKLTHGDSNAANSIWKWKCILDDVIKKRRS